jgi:hypothetical protein
MVTPSTTVFFLIPSRKPIPTLKPPDKPPLMLKKLPIPGEKDPLQTPD